MGVGVRSEGGGVGVPGGVTGGTQNIFFSSVDF